MFSVCPHLGGYPSQVQTGGVPQPSPHGGYPGQVQMGGTPARSDGGAPARSDGWGIPQPGLIGGGGVPQSGVSRGTGEHMEYLISGDRYASCVHAGGLSCWKVICLDRLLFFQCYFVEKNNYKMPVVYKIFWIFHNISLNAAPLISVVYWLVVFGK